MKIDLGKRTRVESNKSNVIVGGDPLRLVAMLELLHHLGGVPLRTPWEVEIGVIAGEERGGGVLAVHLFKLIDAIL